MHRRWPIDNDDYLYVLSTFVVVPARWIDRYGPRRCSPVERTAMAGFYRRLGEIMAVRDLPATYDGFEAILTGYEDSHFRPTELSARLMAATRQVFADRLPRPLRGASSHILAALLDDHVARALGMAPAHPAVRAALGAGLRMRAAVVALAPTRHESWFRPGEVAEAVYPEGYAIDDLGPEHPVHPATGTEAGRE